MPEYLTPGVYVEEVRSRERAIEGVSTSTAAFVGPAPRGPSRPTLVTGWSGYQRIFGAGGEHEGTFLPYAVRGFFENGGQRLYVARVGPSEGGEACSAADFIGMSDTETRSGTGLSGLAGIGELSIICVPDSVNEDMIADAAERDALVDAQIDHCERLRDRFAILNVPAGSDDADRIRPDVDSSWAAVYFPWLRVATFDGGSTVLVPPGGHVAGIYARADASRGVHEAPANEVVHGVVQPALAFDIGSSEQGELNALGINAIRQFPGRGVRVWGARTLSSDPEWKYVNVRRVLTFLEQSIEAGTQWAVFEPNGPDLWQDFRRSIEDFLRAQWLAGALQGATPDEAFFVRCDRSTMTRSDLDDGRLICDIGVAPVKPAEFVVFRIARETAGEP